MGEWAPFAYCLAGRLEGMYKQGLIAVGTPFWETAVENLLLHTINADTRVRQNPKTRWCAPPSQKPQ